jgi:hypothetical protein
VKKSRKRKTYDNVKGEKTAEPTNQKKPTRKRKRPECGVDGCTTEPNFNEEGEKKGLRCKKHKTSKMSNVNSPKCKHPGEGCKTEASFGDKVEKKRVRCATHAEPGMVDVVSPRCKYPEGCETIAIFGDKVEKKRLRCFDHAEPGMVDVVSPRCKHPEDCEERAYFNDEGKRPEYCREHKLAWMIDVHNKTCENKWCYTRVCNDKYKGFCLRCYVDKFPNEPLSRNYKNKEDEVSKFIKSNYPELKWVTDRTIAGGCSRLRPDLLLDLGYQLVIIEIDEHQHVGYSCENNRLKQLSQDAGLPIVFIRFNPDQYTDIKMTRITSCWSPNSDGKLTVTNSKRQEWETRLGVLKTQVDYWLTNKTTEIIELVQLFYDQIAQ